MNLTLAMAALTTLLLALGAWGITHAHDASPGPACHSIPGTTRLDCDR